MARTADPIDTAAASAAIRVTPILASEIAALLRRVSRGELASPPPRDRTARQRKRNQRQRDRVRDQGDVAAGLLGQGG